MKYLLVLITFCLVLTVIWFYQGNIIGGGDAGFAFYSPSISLNISKKTWIEYDTGVSTLGYLPIASLLSFYSILEKIGIPTFILQASLFFIIMSVGTLSIYLLCLLLLEKNENRKLISFITAVFYLFNPFTVSQIWARGQLPQQVSFALFPLVLMLFVVGIRKKSFLFALLIVLASLIFSTAFGYLTNIIVLWSILATCLVFNIVTSPNKLNAAIFGIIFFCLAFFLWIGINAWWLLPLFISSGTVYSSGISGSAENLSTLLGVSKSFPPDIMLRLLQKSYFFTPTTFDPIDSSFLLQLISFIPPIFLFIGLIKILKNKDLIKFKLFIALLFLGFIVSAGANAPFGWLFVEAFKQFSVLQAFRNSFEKFGLVFVLGYSPIFAYGLVWFLDKKKYKNIGLLLVLILTCGIFAWPMWTGRVIAGPDKKIGIKVPQYYEDLRSWLKDRIGDNRIFMTPLWSGDGAIYDWPGGGRFQGSDPMMFILDTPAVSNSIQAPFYYEFMTNIRKYSSQLDVDPSLQLLRTKYLVNRKDALMITNFEKEHVKFLTETIYPPIGDNEDVKKICKNLKADSSTGGIAWVSCKLSPDEGDWSGIRYLHIKVRTNESSYLDIGIRDKNGIRVRWYGKADDDYSIDKDNWKLITVPLSNPTEPNYAMDFSSVEVLDIQVYPKDEAATSVVKLELESISLDPGKKETINNPRLVNSLGQLDVYEFNEFNPPPEFGVLSQTIPTENFLQLFEQVENHKEDLDKVGFLIKSQNSGKNLQNLTQDILLKVANKAKISSTRYWLKTEGNGQGLILLSKTFDSQWKVIPNVTKEQLSGNIRDDFNLLKELTLAEDRHFVINGYANLWRVDGQDKEYAIVYMPQIVADIGLGISEISVVPLLGITFLLLLKQYVKRKN